ncbi:MAG: hypothetical protein ACO388_05765 [Saprospiraceae bacterium]|jgi:hypothetical protein
MKKIITSVIISFMGLGDLFANTSLREELQRYMGYENLPMRYLTIVYDVLMGNNITIDSYDVGFLYFTVLPILFVFYRPKSWWWLFPLAFLYLYLVIPYGYAASKNLPLEEALLQEEALWGMTLWKNSIVNWNQWLLENLVVIKGWTYLLLVSVFAGLLRLILTRKSWLNSSVALFMSILFFWVILSSGVPWYGIVLIPAGLLTIGMAYENYGNRIESPTSFKLIMGILVSFQMLIWLTFRLSGYYATPQLKGYMAEAASVQYQAGYVDQNSYQEILTKVPTDLLDYLNKDQSNLIYRNGTNLQYFIENNKKRVFEDNQLGNFEILNSLFADKIDIARAMELSGIKFLIIDLNMANIDKTPEKSLFKKYEKLIRFLYKNAKLQLLYTDRIVQNSETGKREQRVFDNGQTIIQPGSLAIYMII